MAQAGLGWVLAEVIVAFGIYDLTERQYGLVVLIAGAVLSALQNLAENKGWVRPFLRKVPPYEVPTP